MGYIKHFIIIIIIITILDGNTVVFLKHFLLYYLKFQ